MMKLAHYEFNNPIEFEENKINVIIIENAVFLRNIIETAENQINGENGEFVLSENGKITEMRKKAVLITDLFHLNTNTKSIISNI